VTKPISSFAIGTIEKQQTTYENVFPVRPNTYSVNNLRKSTPSVTLLTPKSFTWVVE
jgi:uncharacterized phage infection (PIP) family protein YhgE